MSRQIEWIYPFRGRNESLGTSQNFLWRNDSVFIMDNHRAGAWCWMQGDLARHPHSVLHIDAHFDTRGAGDRVTAQLGETIRTLSFEDYLALSITDGNHSVPIFCWDNYISLYEYLHCDRVTEWVFSTHRIGTEPTFDVTEVAPDGLVEFLRSISPRNERWIINLDLDFFVSQDGARFPTNSRIPVYQELRRIGRSAVDSITTIALSPECCGSWHTAETLCREFCDVWQLPFMLPEEVPDPLRAGEMANGS